MVMQFLVGQDEPSASQSTIQEGNNDKEEADNNINDVDSDNSKTVLKINIEKQSDNLVIEVETRLADIQPVINEFEKIQYEIENISKNVFEELDNRERRLVFKFHYLRASLGGEAEQVISSLEISAANYDIAWNLLCERFANTRLLIYSYTKALFDLQPIPKESSTHLRQLIDNVSKNLRSLESLQQPVHSWDTLLIFMIASKLDALTAREWESYRSGSDLPTFEDMIAFLKGKADLLEKLEVSKVTSNCKYGACKKCKAKHHSLLHLDKQSVHTTDTNQRVESEPEHQVSLSAHSNVAQSILSTAVVQIFDKIGRVHQCRAFLDCGSQSNLITRELADKLALSRSEVNISIVGIGHAVSNIRSKCTAKIQSRQSSFSTSLSCLVVNSICDRIPAYSFDIGNLDIPRHLRLADPDFHVASKIDILIGVDTFWKILCVGQFSLGPSAPVMQKTRFGWIVSGQFNDKGSSFILQLQ
ncbi:uncharacterized protein [Diabrotica undecimpunctata]|uniref:uncharacterized protein n=1 Tax=Diabrotica undecimpunctata TaxID=50387 RepID=UPI003B641A3F